MDELTRRDMLKAGIGIVALPLGASLVPQTRIPIAGQHYNHYYEVIHDWLKPPAGLAWGDTHGLATDSKGNIYVAHTVGNNSEKSQAVVVYDKNGNFLNAWGDEFRGGAHGLDLRRERDGEYLYHCDVNKKVVTKTDLSGRVVWQFGVPTESKVYEGKPWNPTNVAFHPDGNHFYLGDGYGSSYIHLFDINGKHVQVIAGPGSGEGQVSCPHGLWVDHRGKTPRLAVADRSNRRIQYLTLEGKHISFLKDGVRLPCHIHYNQGLMLVPDLDSVVTIFDANDQVVAKLGDDFPSGLRGRPRSEYKNGKFIHPHAAIWINDRDILVAEWVPDGRLTLIRKL